MFERESRPLQVLDARPLTAIYIYELTLCGEVHVAGPDFTARLLLLLLKRLCSSWKLESSLSNSHLVHAVGGKFPPKISNKGLKS